MARDVPVRGQDAGRVEGGMGSLQADPVDPRRTGLQAPERQRVPAGEGLTYAASEAASPAIRTAADMLTPSVEWPGHLSVMPAQAGIHRPDPRAVERWVPASAGTTGRAGAG